MEANLPNDFKDFLKLLEEFDVKYLLIGGYAVGYHGYPRATNDIDIWIDNSDENVTRIIQAIRKFGFDLPELNIALFTDKKNIIRMGKEPIKIELMMEVDGISFAESFANKIETIIDGIKVCIIGLADLRINKKASGRMKDLADLDYLPK